jgi:hypothetical protein
MRLVTRALAILLKECSFLSAILHVPAPQFDSIKPSPLSWPAEFGACALLFPRVTPAPNQPAPAPKKGTRNYENIAIASNDHFSRYFVEQFVSPRLGFGGGVFRD